ncbi:Uncharacterised protein [Klebsiella pneumoniae]|uniref:Uncharacterized protein n=1 Tax=Klebsiella pneumoniae TaxID=573 RepID=A0A378F8E5_KLEPN|nr:Uncharacterised protein [Klebsiella pneumoniae]
MWTPATGGQRVKEAKKYCTPNVIDAKTTSTASAL